LFHDEVDSLVRRSSDRWKNLLQKSDSLAGQLATSASMLLYKLLFLLPSTQIALAFLHLLLRLPSLRDAKMHQQRQNLLSK
jgi:hypothetical protein